VINPVKPALVSDRETLLQIQELRTRAWAVTGEVPSFIADRNILSDPHDVSGLHWAILDHGVPIAAARMNIHQSILNAPDPEAFEGYEAELSIPIAVLTRLVVDPRHRRRGLGHRLRIARIEVATARGCSSIVGVAEEEYVMRDFEALGFKRLGPTKFRYLSYAPSIVLHKDCRT
jgi:GNAT superfamily N-acetyltransferase